MGLLKSFGLLSITSLFNQIIFLLLTPVITRYFSPLEYGTYSLISSFATISVAICTLKYELLLPVIKNNEREKDFKLFISLVVIMIAFPISLIFWIYIGDFWSAAFAFLMSSVSGMISIQLYHLTRLEDFRRIALLKAVSQGMMPFMQILFSFLPNALILGDLISRFLSLLATRFGLLKLKSFSRENIEFALKNKEYPLYLSTAAILNTANLHLPVFLIMSKLGALEAGLYGMMRILFQAPAYAVGQPFAQVYYARIAKLVKSSNSIRSDFIRFSVIMLFIAISANLVFYYLLKQVGDAVLPDSWKPILIYMPVFFVLSIAQTYVGVFSQTLNLLNKSRWQLIWDFSRTLVLIMALLSVESSLEGYIKCIVDVNTFSYVVMYILIVIFVVRNKNG